MNVSLFFYGDCNKSSTETDETNTDSSRLCAVLQKLTYRYYLAGSVSMKELI